MNILRPRAFIVGFFLLVGSSVLTKPIFAALYLSAQDGRWADPSTWDPKAVPSDGDEAIIFHNVTIDSPVVIGANSVGSTAITLFSRATCTITTDGTLTLHGDVVQRNGAFAYGQGAGKIIFDATKTDPTSTTFVWQIANEYLGSGPIPQLVIRGTPTARFRVESPKGSGHGRFTNGGINGGGSVDAEYADFVRIGDATKLAIAPAVPFINSPILVLRNCRFFQSGEVSPSAANGARSYISQPKTGFDIENCQFVRSVSATAFTFMVGNQPHFDGWIATGNDFQGPVELNSPVTLSNNRYRSAWKLNNTNQTASPTPYPAMTYLLSGPSALVKGVPATFTIALDANNTATGLTISLSDGGQGGTFSPTTVTLDGSHLSQTMTYTPTKLGSIVITPSNNQGLLDDDPIPAVVTEETMTYLLTAPSPATSLVGAPSDPIVVALPPYTTVKADMTINLNDGGNGGTLTPASVVLSNANPSASVSYNAAHEGKIVITAVTNPGLTNPSPITIDATSSKVTGCTLTGPDRGDVTEPSGIFTVRLNDGAISGTIQIRPSASNGDGIFDPALIELSNSQREATFIYTPKLFGSRGISVTNDRGLTNPPNIPYLSMIQLGYSGVTKTQDKQQSPPNFGGLNPLAADSAWFNEFKRDVSDLPADPHSDEMLARIRNVELGFNPVITGSWTPDSWGWYTEPYNVVSGNVPILSIPGTWSYNPASNGPYLLPPPPLTFQGYTKTDYPVGAWPDDGDHHLHVYRRNETTGGFKELWEYYQPIVTKDAGGNIVSVKGASWRRFDLENGETPVPDQTTTDAAGMMFMPLVPRYEEVATGVVNHAFRWEANNTDISPTHKWPARTNAGAWNLMTGIPYGGRIRIKQSWMDANADSVLGINTHARIIAEAITHYGLILSDGTFGTQIEMPFVSDNRWDTDISTRLHKIPTSAFEVVKTPPLFQIDGPTTLQVGETGTWRMTVMPKESPVGTGVGVNMYAWNKDKNSNGALLKYLWCNLPATARQVTGSYSFTTAGMYRINPTKAWNTGFGPFLITVGDAAIPATTYWIYLDGPETVNNPVTVTVMVDHKFTGVVTLTPSGCGVTAPIDVSFNNETTKTITVTPSSGGLLTMTGTNAAGLTNSDPATYRVLAPATTYSIKGPSTALKGHVSEPFTIMPNGFFTGSITPNDGGAGGTFSPAVLSWSGTNLSAKSFTYTPTNAGSVTINTTNDASLTAASPLQLTVLGEVGTALNLTGPSNARVGEASAVFTVTPNGPFGGTVTPSDGNGKGIFTPSRLTWSYTSSPQTFTYTPAVAGAQTVSISNNQGLTNPNPISVTVAPQSSPGVVGGSSKQSNLAYIVKRGQSAKFSCSEGVVKILNRRGEVKQLSGAAASDGSNTFIWDMTDATSQEVPSGVYRVNSTNCSAGTLIYVR